MPVRASISICVANPRERITLSFLANASRKADLSIYIQMAYWHIRFKFEMSRYNGNSATNSIASRCVPRLDGRSIHCDDRDQRRRDCVTLPRMAAVQRGIRPGADRSSRDRNIWIYQSHSRPVWRIWNDRARRAVPRRPADHHRGQSLSRRSHRGEDCAGRCGRSCRGFRARCGTGGPIWKR